MFWWVVLGYVLFSPVLGLVVGGAIRMQDSAPGSSRQKASFAVEPCPPRTTARLGGQMKVVAGR